MSRPDADLLAERYGHRNGRLRAVVVVVVAVIVVAFLAWLGWAAWVHSHPAIRAEVAAFDIPNAHEARARVDVRLGDPDVTGTCLLRATAADHSIVGERNVAVQDLGRHTWVGLRTERRATSVTVEHCTAG